MFEFFKRETPQTASGELKQIDKSLLQEITCISNAATVAELERDDKRWPKVVAWAIANVYEAAALRYIYLYEQDVRDWSQPVMKAVTLAPRLTISQRAVERLAKSFKRAGFKVQKAKYIYKPDKHGYRISW